MDDNETDFSVKQEDVNGVDNNIDEILE